MHLTMYEPLITGSVPYHLELNMYQGVPGGMHVILTAPAGSLFRMQKHHQTHLLINKQFQALDINNAHPVGSK